MTSVESMRRMLRLARIERGVNVVSFPGPCRQPIQSPAELPPAA